MQDVNNTGNSATLKGYLGTLHFGLNFFCKPKTAQKNRLLWLLLLSRFSRVRLGATPWTAAHQAPPSLGFFRQEYWSGLPFPSPVHARMLSRFSRV